MMMKIYVMRMRAEEGHLSFEIECYDLAMDCWKFYGDPIFDTDGDVSSDKNDDLLTYEQPNSLEKNADFPSLE